MIHIPVQGGDELLVPLFNGDTDDAIRVSWTQDFCHREAYYHALLADNLTTGMQPSLFLFSKEGDLTSRLAGEQVPFFIAAEYYEDHTEGSPDHITRVGEFVEGGQSDFRHLVMKY